MRRRISVIVPTYDRPKTLREALESIQAVAAANYDLEFEIVVGDNGLKDETREICGQFNAVYAPAYGKGASYGRNAALKAASGDFIAFLDDDDVWLQGHMRPHLAYLDAHPHHDAVFGQAIYADHNLEPTSDPWPQEHPGEGDELLRRMLSGLFPQIGTFLARRVVIDQIGFFDTHLVGGQDLDWMLRLAGKRRLGFVATPCVLFRGRPPLSSDKLQRMRIGFDRHVFLRHSLPNAHRLWKSPLGFARAYHATLGHFYSYFISKADWLVENGQSAEAVRALVTPMLNLPLLAAVDLVRPSKLRTVIGKLLRGGARPAPSATKAS